MVMMMYEQGKAIDQLCRDGSRNSSLRSVVRSYHDDEESEVDDNVYVEIGLEKASGELVDDDADADVVDDDDDDSGLDKVSEEL